MSEKDTKKGIGYCRVSTEGQEENTRLKQDYSSFIDKYEYRLFYSEEDEGYIATIAELPNCSAFGDDPLEALQEAKKAASLYIEYFLEKEVEVPEPFCLTSS